MAVCHLVFNYPAPQMDALLTAMGPVRTQYLAQHGRSRLDGLTVERLGPMLSTELYADN
jgi:hypothetical protein